MDVFYNEFGHFDRLSKKYHFVNFLDVILLKILNFTPILAIQYLQNFWEFTLAVHHASSGGFWQQIEAMIRDLRFIVSM